MQYPFEAVVEKRDRDTAARDAELPRASHIHVGQVGREMSIQIPHFGPKLILATNIGISLDNLCRVLLLRRRRRWQRWRLDKVSFGSHEYHLALERLDNRLRGDRLLRLAYGVGERLAAAAAAAAASHSVMIRLAHVVVRVADLSQEREIVVARQLGRLRQASLLV